MQHFLYKRCVIVFKERKQASATTTEEEEKSKINLFKAVNKVHRKRNNSCKVKKPFTSNEIQWNLIGPKLEKLQIKEMGKKETISIFFFII